MNTYKHLVLSVAAVIGGVLTFLVAAPAAQAAEPAPVVTAVEALANVVTPGNYCC